MATKARKQEIVGELKEFFKDGKVAIVTDLSGLTVAEITAFAQKARYEQSQMPYC